MLLTTSQLKAPVTMQTNQEYLEAFHKGFLINFGNKISYSESEFAELYFDFINIAFTKAKVNKIIKLYADSHEYLPKNVDNSRKSTLGNARNNKVFLIF